MPVDTNSESWKNSGRPEFPAETLVEFFSENPEKAYHIREIAEEAFDVEWSKLQENIQLGERYDSGEIGREEYDDQKSDVVSIYSLAIQTEALKLYLLPLVEKGLIEARVVDVSDRDLMQDDDEIIHYTYALS